MISKTIPYTTASVSPSGACLELPVGYRIEGANELFVWREKSTGNVILSAKPPERSVAEFFMDADASLPDELTEKARLFFDKTYLEPIRQRKMRSKNPA